MPIYMKIQKKEDGKEVFKFASIEFLSHTYREFDNPEGIDIQNSRFVIFDIKDDNVYW